MTQRRNPTQEVYRTLDAVYSIFNTELFGGQLRNPLVSIQRLRGAFGCFAGARYLSHDAADRADAVIVDARYWGPRRTDAENLSTFAHEMTHLWQYHHGKAGRTRYHNRQFSQKMLDIGLVTSDTGLPGGKPIGSRMSHYIQPGGRFEALCIRLAEQGLVLPYHEPSQRNDLPRRLKKAASKSPYLCAECDPPARVWGKQGLNIVCGICESPFICDEPSPADPLLVGGLHD